jgi:hypothetical protein
MYTCWPRGPIYDQATGHALRAASKRKECAEVNDPHLAVTTNLGPTHKVASGLEAK